MAARGAPDRAPVAGDGFRAIARALLTFAFVVYLAVVGASVAGLAPLRAPLAAWSVLALGALAALASLRGVSFSYARPAVTARGSERALEVAGLSVAGAGCLATLAVFALALRLPVGAYDALGYRLPAVAQWLDAGALAWVDGDDPLRNGYPLGLEVLEAVLFVAFDSPAAVDAVATWFVLAGAGALAGFARALGAAPFAAALAAGLFLLVPVHLLNSPSGYADAAFSGCLVALLVAVARWIAAPRAARSTVLEVGLSAALVTALKPHGLAFAGIALAAALLLRWRDAGWRCAGGEAALSAALWAPGLFFAARNLKMTGNPLYPLEVRIGEQLVLRGESSLSGILTPEFNVPGELSALPGWLRPLWVWLQPHGPAESFDDRLAGFGYAFLLLGLPALAWATHRAFARRGALRGLGLVSALTLVFWLLQPLSFWPRFSSWLWGAAALSIALLVSELSAHGRARGALWLTLCAAALAIPEALYALAHVKGLDRLGLSLFERDPVTVLAQISGVDAGFVRRALLGKRDVCRTPWRLGTDDANLDGVVAQLSPRPRMHVVDESRWSALADAVRARGCDQLIAIGESPLLESAPPGGVRIEPARAFGACHLIRFAPVLSSSAEVIP